MSFSFGFSGDDIEEDSNATSPNNDLDASATASTTTDSPPPIPARTHDLDELVGKNTPKQNHLTNPEPQDGIYNVLLFLFYSIRVLGKSSNRPNIAQIAPLEDII